MRTTKKNQKKVGDIITTKETTSHTLGDGVVTSNKRLLINSIDKELLNGCVCVHVKGNCMNAGKHMLPDGSVIVIKELDKDDDWQLACFENKLVAVTIAGGHFIVKELIGFNPREIGLKCYIPEERAVAVPRNKIQQIFCVKGVIKPGMDFQMIVR